MSRLANVESEYELLKLEADFAAKKEAGSVTTADKEALRRIREAYRLHYRLPTLEGAAPPSIDARTKWQRIMEVLKEQ